jgi:hypothetical protein
MILLLKNNLYNNTKNAPKQAIGSNLTTVNGVSIDV